MPNKDKLKKKKNDLVHHLAFFQGLFESEDGSEQVSTLQNLLSLSQAL
jgi:hypothetical protein